MADVRRIRPEAVLFLAGDGPETPHLKRLGNELGLGSGLRFLGSVSNADLPPLYKAAWVSILPSLYEAVSLSGLESLACGVPVVGTRVGGIPEIVLDGITGILVPPRSPEALAAAILDLVGNAERRHAMGEEARRLVVREYTWEIIAKRTLEFYGRCMETSP
jgi:glycosyltransferase involved in cell wall biosynthesis